MADQAPKIDSFAGKGKLVFDRESKTIRHEKTLLQQQDEFIDEHDRYERALREVRARLENQMDFDNEFSRTGLCQCRYCVNVLRPTIAIIDQALGESEPQ